MKTIELILPDDIGKSLNSIEVAQENFILEAITEKLHRLDIQNMKTLLEEGYKVTNEEDLEITKEYEFIDLHGKFGKIKIISSNHLFQ
jgi:hypothetical protein